MRAKRILLILAGASAGVAAAAVVAALSPPVQTWVARWAVARANGPVTAVGRVSVGLSRATLDGLRVETDEGVLTAPSAEADFAVIPALLGGGYHFKGLVSKGWTYDLTRAGLPAALPERDGRPWYARVVWGVLAALNERADLSLDDIDLEGDVIFPDDIGRPAGKAHVVVTGGGLGVGRDGRFLCRVTAAVNDASAAVASVDVEATLTATLGASGAVARADLKAEARASGPEFPGGIGLSFVAWAERDAAKASYSVSLIRGSERIAEIDAESPFGSSRASGSWRLDLRDTDLAPFALGRSLPTFYAAGSGVYEIEPSTGDVHASGNLTATADRLGVVSRSLGALGPVELLADFDVAHVGESLRVSRLEVSLEGARPVVAVRALQSFEFNPRSGELKVAVPSGDLVGISLTGLPLSWLKGAIPRLDIGGNDALGEFAMRAEDGRLALRTRTPLTVTGASLAVSGRPAGAGLDISAYVLADYALQGWQLQLAPLEVRSEGIRIFSLEARFGRLAGPDKAVKAAGSWSASLPGLLAQPAAAGLPRLSAGEASGSFEANLESTRELRVKAALKDLALADGSGAALPSITSEVRADIDAEGRTTFGIPVHLDYGSRALDLAFSGSVASDSKGPFVDARLEGTRLLADDLFTLGALSGWGSEADDAAPAPAAAPPQAGPAAPFWPRVRGRVALSIEDIAFPRVELRNVRGTLGIERDSLSAAGGTASLGDGSLARLDGRIDFTGGAVRPYSLRASLSLDNVDSAPLFRSISPDRAPLIEGRFDVVSHLTGGGTGVADLLDRLQGELTLTSKSGIFRALQTDVVESIKQAPSKLVGALDSVTSLFGKKSENIATALVESAKDLSEVHYDQMSATVERGADRDILLTAITLIAPEERLAGTGRIAYAQGVATQDQGLSVDLDMGARGHLAKILDILGLLKEGQDELGYSQLVQPIHLGGSLRNIDQSQWKDMLIQAPLRKGGGLFDKLLGR